MKVFTKTLLALALSTTLYAAATHKNEANGSGGGSSLKRTDTMVLYEATINGETVQFPSAAEAAAAEAEEARKKLTQSDTSSNNSRTPH